MKTRLATALSLAGVLAAGSAAALANTQVLDGGAPASGASAAVLPDAQPVDLTIPPSTSPATTTTLPSTTAPSSSSTSSTSPATSSPPETSEFLTTFNVGSAGSVTLDVVAGRLRLVEALPGTGWAVADSEEHGDENEVEVEFRSADTAVEFEAELIGGEIVPHVASRSLIVRPASSGTAPAPAPVSPSAPATPSAGTVRDDDHEDRDERDDDHEERDDDHEDREDRDDDHEERDDD